jgi:hypothetical protein
MQAKNHLSLGSQRSTFSSRNRRCTTSGRGSPCERGEDRPLSSPKSSPAPSCFTPLPPHVDANTPCGWLAATCALSAEVRIHRSNSAHHKSLHGSDGQTGSKAGTFELTAIHAVTENAWRMGLLEEDKVGALALQHARTHLAVRGRALLAGPSNTWECALIAVGRGRNPPSCTFQNIQPHHAQNILQDPPTLPSAWHVDNKLPATTNNLLSHFLAIALEEFKQAPSTTSRRHKCASQAFEADKRPRAREVGSRHSRCVRRARNLLPQACERCRVVSRCPARLERGASGELERRQGLALDRAIEGDLCSALGGRKPGQENRVRHSKPLLSRTCSASCRVSCCDAIQSFFFVARLHFSSCNP